MSSELATTAPYSCPTRSRSSSSSSATSPRARSQRAPPQLDEKSEYGWEIRRILAENDIFGLPFDTEHGGTGTGTLMLNIAIEELAKADASTASSS